MCSCDFDAPEFYSAVRPKARKEHKCCECRSVIQAGERYERVSAKWDGDILVFKTCTKCLTLRDEIELKSDCFCWHHENLIEDATMQAKEEGYRVPGLRMLVGRYLVNRAKGFKGKKASDFAR